MIRLILIFIITFIMVMDAGAQDRRRGGGDGWRGGDRGGPSRGYGGGRAVHHYYHDRRPGYRYEAGRGWYDPSAVIGGAIGGWLWRQWAQPEPPPPPPVVVVQEAPARTVGWCLDRYRSYDPVSRSYLGYDGYRHSCP